MTVETPAFTAVAVNHVHDLGMDFEPDPSAKATTSGNGFRVFGARVHLYHLNIVF
jgi:hypothetical protein